MQIGIVLPSFSSDSHRWSAGELRHAIRRISDADFEGAYFLEHLTRPATYNTAWMEPVTTAAWAAGVAGDVAIGTSVLVASLRNPVILTWQLLTLQHLTQQPLRIGVGAGYVPAEFEAVALPLKDRGKRLDRFLEMFDKASLHGIIDTSADGEPIEPIEIGPASEIRTRTMVGGASRSGIDAEAGFPPAVLRRILRWKGWISSPKGISELRDDWHLICDAADGQAIAHDHLNYVHISHQGTADDAIDEQGTAFEWLYGAERGRRHAVDNCLVGTREQIGERLLALGELGVGRTVLQLVAPTPHGWHTQFDRLESLVEDLHLLE